MKRVVVTGMGAISPIGNSVAEAWGNALEGISGAAPITLFDTADMRVTYACEVKGFDPEQFIERREARRRDRFAQFATAAAQEAVSQAGLVIEPEQAGRVGVVIASAVGGMGAIEDSIRTVFEQSPRRVSPFMIPMFMPNGASGLLAIDLGAKGPAYSVASACASGADGIGQAWMLIRSGMIDAAVAGGSDATITRSATSGFDRLGTLSLRGDTTAPAPFDVDRDGFVMGEGAAVMVLESEDHARARGAEILAELSGYGSTADAHHITAPTENGVGGAAAIRDALSTAGLNADEVDYVNAHGTGTELNDISETRAIKAALGDHAHTVPVSSTKSMTGHMIGATGALEAVFSVMAVRDDVLPPTINLHNPDPECDLDYVPREARQLPVDVAISNSFGFGGHNSVLAFRAYSG